MRQVFASARLENVEAVAKLLADEGIEVRIQGGRSFRGGIRGDFSYRDGHGGGERPSVWVVRTDEQTRARALLREHGLLQTPDRSTSFLGSTPHARPPADAGRAPSRGRFLLLAALGVAMVAAFFAGRGLREPREPRADVSPSTFPDPGAPGGLAPIPEEVVPEVHVIAVPPALARVLFAIEAAGDAAPGCLAIDGRDPPPGVVDALAAAGMPATPASACPDGAGVLDVARWRTDGSGRGTVELRLGDAPARVLAVRREGPEWHVEGTPPAE